MPKGKQSKPVAYRCLEPFAYYGSTGVPRYYTAGQVVAATDPIIKTHRHAFTDAFPEDDPVEQATQAPGERRPVRRKVPEPSTQRAEAKTEANTEAKTSDKPEEGDQ